MTFHLNKTFVRNNLFEKVIKSCKATSLEFLKLKEKLDLCLYEVICGEQNLFQRQKKFLKKKKFLNSMMLKISN